MIQASRDGKHAAMIEINSETDFVARDTFLAFADTVAQTVLGARCMMLKPFITPISGTNMTVEDARQALVAKVGENINIRRVALLNTSGISVHICTVIVSVFALN